MRVGILNSCLLVVLANLDNFRLFTKEVYSFLIELLKVKPMSVLATLRLILSLFWSSCWQVTVCDLKGAKSR